MNANMISIREIFAPLIGQLTWQVKGGSATFVTMEFGNPHLSVRNPTKPKADGTSDIQRLRERRLVTPRGDWRLFIEFAKWRVRTAHGTTSSDENSDDWWKLWLDDVSGQRLLAVESPGPGYLTLRFDLGGIVEVWPHPDIENDVWTLHPWEGNIIGCSHEGVLHCQSRRSRP